jgi:hypothetical protein
MAAESSDGLGGRAGERWRNTTDDTWYQLVSSLRKPCAVCLRRHGRISSRPWPIPFHPHCECEQLEIRWDVPVAGLARRSIRSVTATVSSSQFISRPDKGMRAKRSSPRWPVSGFTAAAAKVVGHGESLPRRGTVIRASGSGVGGGSKRPSPREPNRSREEPFDKATDRQRHIVAQVVGWYKEYRALGTRYEELAVDDVALWLVAIMDKALHRLFPDGE